MAAWAGKAPSTFQPVRRRVAREKARSSVLTTGVSKIVWCMGKQGQATPAQKAAARQPVTRQAWGRNIKKRREYRRCGLGPALRQDKAWRLSPRRGRGALSF
ncbi:hypothetical protein GmRootA79_02170 [Acidovorax sp. A79]